MKRLLIISSLSLLPFNNFAADQVNFSNESQLEQNPYQIEMKEVLKEIQETCQDQNSLLRSALRILRTALQKSSIDSESASHSSDVKLSAKISLDGLDLVQLFSLKGSMIQSADSQSKPKWCVH
jgi:hypothetical protein